LILIFKRRLQINRRNLNPRNLSLNLKLFFLRFHFPPVFIWITI
jgi:hypothetical protein